jgi:hypothetical protein
MPPCFPRIALAAVASGLCAVALAQPAPPSPALTLRFSELEAPLRSAPGQGALDLGTLRAQPSRGRALTITIRKRIGLLLDGRAAHARVSASLAAEAAQASVAVDGRRLSTIPVLIDAAHRVGTTVAHDIEVTIPAHVPPGPFLAGIVWHAETP